MGSAPMDRPPLLAHWSKAIVDSSFIFDRIKKFHLNFRFRFSASVTPWSAHSRTWDTRNETDRKSPDSDAPFLITTDTSDYALGVILSQWEIEKHWPCAYASRTRSGAELKYSTHDKELVADSFAVEQLRLYLYGHYFTVSTRHLPLK